jgi:hypothetical protein
MNMPSRMHSVHPVSARKERFWKVTASERKIGIGSCSPDLTRSLRKMAGITPSKSAAPPIIQPTVRAPSASLGPMMKQSL